MDCKFDVVLKNGFIVDPASVREGVMDVAIVDGKIVKVDQDIDASDAREVFDLQGYYVLPGIIDLHVHSSEWLGGRYAHKMLAQAGVTTALDMSGPVESVVDIARDYGTGLNIACIHYVRPGHTVRDENPSTQELESLLNESMSKGALGFKLLGGHYPLTPDASARAIEVVNNNKAYIAFHAGSSSTGSNIEGFLEAVKLADGKALHVAHINSYCRGSIRSCMEEAEEAIKALIENPNIRSEAYLSSNNGTSGKCTDGVPESLVTRRCLITGGFAPTEDGLEQAIKAGWAKVNCISGGKMILAQPQDGLKYWRDMETNNITLSFSVNPPDSRIRLATAKRPSGEFVVDSISTDGGGIPRNVIIEMGLSLIKLDALTWQEFAHKTSYKAAQILGLKNKGQLTMGADADITVIDYGKQKAYMTISNGKVVMLDGYVMGQGSTIVTTEQGKAYVEARGLKAEVVDLANSAFYGK